MLAMEFSIEPPPPCLAASSSRSMSGCVESPSTPKGMSRLLCTQKHREARRGEAQTAPGYVRYHVPSLLARRYHCRGRMLRKYQVKLLSLTTNAKCMHVPMYLLPGSPNWTAAAALRPVRARGSALPDPPCPADAAGHPRPTSLAHHCHGEQDIVGRRGCRQGRRSLCREVLTRADEAGMTTLLFGRFRMVVVASVVLRRSWVGNMVCKSRRIGGSGDPSNTNKWNLGLSTASRKICHDWYISWR